MINTDFTLNNAILSSPPAPLAPIAFDIAQPSQDVLENGLRVVVFENERLPLVNFRLAFFAGDIHDPAEHHGLTSAMATQLTEGTESYSSLQLAEKVERLGASISAHASYDFTTISASSLSLYADEMIDLLAEVTLRPTFPEEELDLYRRNTVESLKFQRSQPPFLAAEQAARHIYGTHPYSRVSPTAAEIEKLTRQDLVRHHRRTLIPNNAILIVVGDIKRDELIAQLNDKFAGWEQGSLPSNDFDTPPTRSGRTLTIVDRAGSAQSNIVIANSGIKRLDPDYFPVLVMNQVLGAGASSRVFMNIREDKGYTYGAYTRVDAKMLAGDFEATAEVRNEVTGASLKEFFYELERIRNERVSDEEIADAKSFLTGVFPIRAETQEGLTGLLVNQQIYGLPDDYLQQYRANVDAVTAEQIQEAARKHIRPDEVAIVIVGDADEIMEQVKEYADTVEVYDTEGNKK